jgi:hypothetical protein
MNWVADEDFIASSENHRQGTDKQYYISVNKIGKNGYGKKSMLSRFAYK